MSDIEHYTLLDGSYLMRSTHFIASKGGENFQKLIQAQIQRFIAIQNSNENCIALFDGPTSSDTNKSILSCYKATREDKPKTELELRVFETTRQLVKNMGFGYALHKKLEADQLIGSFSLELFEEGHNVTIYACDKDFNQLVKTREKGTRFIRIYDPLNKVFRKPKDIKARYDVNPKQFATYLALVGDTIDNVPGLAGCGDKTAARLINEYGNYFDMRRALREKPKDKLVKIEKALLENVKELNLCYKVVKLGKYEVEIPKIKKPNTKKLKDICDQEGLRYKSLFGNL